MTITECILLCENQASRERRQSADLIAAGSLDIAVYKLHATRAYQFEYVAKVIASLAHLANCGPSAHVHDTTED